MNSHLPPPATTPIGRQTRIDFFNHRDIGNGNDFGPLANPRGGIIGLADKKLKGIKQRQPRVFHYHLIATA